MFSSDQMEIEYLVAASPHEVLRYLDKKGASHQPRPLDRQCISEALEASLLARNDRLVDIALARVCRGEVVEQILVRRTVDSGLGARDEPEPDPSVMVAALSNPAAMYFLFPNEWLKKWLPWVARRGSKEHLEALFLNPSIPNDVVDDALEGSHAFEGLDQDRRREIVYHALKSKPAVDGPDEKSRDYDLAGNHTLGCVWNLFATTDPRDQGMANVLADALPRLPGFKVPYEWVRSTSGDKKTDWKDDQIKFLQFVFDRWSVGDNGARKEKYDWLPQRVIRELIASLAPYYNEAAKRLVIDHPDVYVRRGYYRGLSEETLDNLKKYHERDGDAFCESAVHNPFFYQRSNQEIVLWFSERVRECEPATYECSYSVSGTYVDVQEDLFKKSPEKYFESQWEAEDPAGYVASQRSSVHELDATEQRDDALLARVDQLSAIAREAAQFRNWLVIALAAAAGFIVAKI